MDDLKIKSFIPSLYPFWVKYKASQNWSKISGLQREQGAHSIDHTSREMSAPDIFLSSIIAG